MKKILLYIKATVCVCIVIAATSCNNELENWNSATYDYDGKFVVSAVCQEHPSKSTIIDKGNEIYLYNTAANVNNEIWLDDVSGKFPLKSKLKLNGNSGGFSGTETVDNLKSILLIYNEDNDEYVQFTSTNQNDFPVATTAGQLSDGIQEYTRITLQEGKILPKAATSIGGNVSDSIYIKLTLHSDNVKFISIVLPEEDWETPGVPEYEWKLQPNSNAADASKDEHWTIAGYRYTGYPEDL